jgi:ABC-type lipoprotein release transport system permease subunit
MLNHHGEESVYKLKLLNRDSAYILFASFLLLILLTVFTTELQRASSLQVTDVELSLISGTIVDAATNHPVVGATIALWETKVSSRESSITLQRITQTGIDGRYEIEVSGETSYRIYAYHDDPTSPGFDYLPQFSTFTLQNGEQKTIDFALLPAASIIFQGDIRIIDSSRPPEKWGFTIVPQEEFHDIKRLVLTYGAIPESHTPFLNISSNHVIVPINSLFQIQIMASSEIYHSISIDISQFVYLDKGAEIQVNVEEYVLLYNLNLTKDFLKTAEHHINETEEIGFYVLSEKRDLIKAQNLIENAEQHLLRQHYDESYADLREAYTKIMFITDQTQAMYVDASASVSIILIFLALTSTTLSYMLFEDWFMKMLATGLSYTLLIVLFYFVYPGCQIVGIPSFLFTSSLSIGFFILTTSVLPHFLPMTVIFSLAKRTIRRRALRFFLTIIPVIVMIMGFVALTSFSTEYGFISSTIGYVDTESEGLLIKQPLPSIPPITLDTQTLTTFSLLDVSIIDWLQTKPEVDLVAPKVENWPSTTPLGSLSTGNESLPIYGVLGILPSAEATLIPFDQLLIGGQGRYLQDGEADAIMISTKLAQTLNVKIGDPLVFRMGSSSIDVSVVGILHDQSISQIYDLDGTSVLPDKIIIEEQDIIQGIVIDAEISPCDPSEVVVTNWQTALKLHSVGAPIFISRINAVLDDSIDLLPFASQIALERDYWVWTTVDGQIHLVGLIPHLEAKGLSIFIPWLIVILNVIIVMINTIYERKREVVILSSIGFNPTHLTSLFGAEALITGVLAGGIGYLLGLTFYRIMSFLSMNLDVIQKISALWTIASLSISITAVLIGTFIALRFSVIITPSLLRKWKTEEKPQGMDSWIFNIPIKVPPTEASSALDYCKKRLQDWKGKNDIHIDRIKNIQEEIAGELQKGISFTYRLGRGHGTFLSSNKLLFSKGKDVNHYTLKLISKAGKDQAYETANFIRRLFLEWSV